MEVSVSKIQVEGEHKSCGITSLLYEARKVNKKSKLNDFVEAVQKIDPTLGLVQTCELKLMTLLTQGLGRVLQGHLDLTNLHSRNLTLKLHVT